MTDKKFKSLTIEKLKQLSGFDSISEEEAIEVISTLEKFSILLVELYAKEQKKQ
jgi:hypothetical protein